MRPEKDEDLSYISVTERHALYLGQKDGWNGHRLESYVPKLERNLNAGRYEHFKIMSEDKLKWFRFSHIGFREILNEIAQQDFTWTIYGERLEDGTVIKHFLFEQESAALFMKMKFN